jgi:hypothetical protein
MAFRGALTADSAELYSSGVAGEEAWMLPNKKESLQGTNADYEGIPRSGLIRLLQEHDAALLDAGRDGIVMSYTGRTAPWQIIRQVKPKLSRIVKKLSVGEEQTQSENEIWDGENLSAMVTLYKYRGQVDLILTDPPYNTGEDFRYNDKWDKDPNDPDLGELVPKDDGSRHSKWLRFMTPRVWMMREMLKPGGVIAICIDHRELFRLGMLMDEIFKEENRLAIINWQKVLLRISRHTFRSQLNTSWSMRSRRPTPRREMSNGAHYRMCGLATQTMISMTGSKIT